MQYLHPTAGPASLGTRTGAVISLLVLLAVVPSTSQAVDHHVCNCAAGADSDCVVGSDAGSGSVVDPWRSYQHARARFATIAAGDSIRWCRGGSWQVDGPAEWINENCTAGLPCRVTAYEPLWGSGDEPRPRIERLDDGDGFSLANPGDAAPQSGYLFEDLHLVGNGGGIGNAFFLFNDIDDVTIRRVIATDFAIGVHLAGANPCGPSPTCDGLNERIVLEDSEIRDNAAFGWLGGSSGSRIRRSLFDGNGSIATFHHNIYLASGPVPVTDLQVVGNTLRNNAIDASGTCNASSLAGHGLFTNVLIEGNFVEETLGRAGPGCWGIAIDPAYDFAERFDHLVIRGNAVRNMGNLSIGTASCTQCLIENNVIVQERALGGRGIAVPNRPLGDGDALDTGLTVRNNSIHYVGPATGIAVTATGTDHRIHSNSIHGVDTPDGGFSCFTIDLAAGAFAGMDHNLCDPGPLGEWVAAAGDLTSWQATTGLDLHSSVADPLFAEPAAGDLAPADASSPMVDTGSPTDSAPTAIDGLGRDTLPDRGAHERRSDLLFADSFEDGDTSSWSAARLRQF